MHSISQLPDNNVHQTAGAHKSIVETGYDVQLGDTPESRTLYCVPLDSISSGLFAVPFSISSTNTMFWNPQRNSSVFSRQTAESSLLIQSSSNSSSPSLTSFSTDSTAAVAAPPENPDRSRNSLGVVSRLQKPLVRSSASKLSFDISGVSCRPSSFRLCGNSHELPPHSDVDFRRSSPFCTSATMLSGFSGKLIDLLYVIRKILRSQIAIIIVVLSDGAVVAMIVVQFLALRSNILLKISEEYLSASLTTSGMSSSLSLDTLLDPSFSPSFSDEQISMAFSCNTRFTSFSGVAHTLGVSGLTVALLLERSGLTVSCLRLIGDSWLIANGIDDDTYCDVGG
ncbi:hypothetical protein X777_14688 [Ooceraea biroi]|uniref:Uncharacterized protein n=1 Tax=Ooceraea biroi TaxID=2015173 RepID=A0A026WS84_OOCBI|nr:hypothetical protein X777_14688 [Ooceraea biroi]